MTVHAMDPVDIFPYKQPQMRKVFGAFRRMLIDTANAGACFSWPSGRRAGLHAGDLLHQPEHFGSVPREHGR
jgi:hypothetical protein